ncbi:amino acid ABC transporter permease [uncultured Dialister sp.]|mgnify:FL=1|jgi:L-cystine transport system permease protein|uniref:amino acid ABC transporter permease n=1 Tax=uncultured Dialister sp. TaxID=278064 RepID=UPI0025EA1CEC|nr:amino acid ABC transporter permease [uncultured Dialister sp.]
MLTFNVSYFLGLFPRLSTALPFTIEVIIASIFLCLFFGTLVAVIRIAKIPVLHQICEVWLSYNRSMPFILDLYLVYFVLPVIVRALHISPNGWPLTAYVLIALSFHYTPVISEIIRPAYLSVDKGQTEAAMVFGLSPFHRVVHIIAPQALPVALPGLVSEAINILKDTSVMFFIGVVDLMGRAGLIINANYGQGKLETYCAVALIYWALVILVELAFHIFQKYNAKEVRRA